LTRRPAIAGRRAVVCRDRLEAALSTNAYMPIRGEHGGEPNSVEFCEELGLTYVSCSPFRVPVARLAAAQAALKKGDRVR